MFSLVFDVLGSSLHYTQLNVGSDFRPVDAASRMVLGPISTKEIGIAYPSVHPHALTVFVLVIYWQQIP